MSEPDEPAATAELENVLQESDTKPGTGSKTDDALDFPSINRYRACTEEAPIKTGYTLIPWSEIGKLVLVHTLCGYECMYRLKETAVASKAVHK